MTRPGAQGNAHRPKRFQEQQQLEAAFAELELDDGQRTNLSRRYLDYMDWLEAAATRSRRAYYGLRLVAVITAAVVPALVASGTSEPTRSIAVALGVVVAAATATEAFLHLGDRWRHYRLTVELLKAEAWLFVQQAGPYAGADARHAVGRFVARMEELIHDEVRDYVSTVVAERAAERGASLQSTIPDAEATGATGRAADSR